MPDLDAVIRARLDEFDDSMGRTGSLWGAEEMRAALLAVLDAHEPEGVAPTRCSQCLDGGPGYEAEPAEWPCPTVQAIAQALGVEAKDA